MPRSPSARVLLLGGPFLLCFVAGQVGGWGGPMIFGLILLPLLLWMPFMLFATGAPMKQAWPSLLPLAAGIGGFAVGASVPAFIGLPRTLG